MEIDYGTTNQQKGQPTASQCSNVSIRWPILVRWECHGTNIGTMLVPMATKSTTYETP